MEMQILLKLLKSSDVSGTIWAGISRGDSEKREFFFAFLDVTGHLEAIYIKKIVTGK